MKTSVYLKKCKTKDGEAGKCNVCFRVREKEIDIKVVSELTILEKYWNADTLTYRRNNVVDLDEQKKFNRIIAEIIDEIGNTFTPNKADSEWLKQIIEDTIYPEKAYARTHPNILNRLSEYKERNSGSINSQTVTLERKLERYFAFKREILGEEKTVWYPDTLTLDDMTDFRDFISNEHNLCKEYPEFYKAHHRKHDRKPGVLSNTSVINIMNVLCVFLHWCKNEGYTDNLVFKQYGTRLPVYGDPFFLTIEERNTLYDADLSDVPKLEAIRDTFVFHCYVGCRIGDLYRLTRNNIIGGFLEYVPEKTKKCSAKTVRVPLHEKAQRILEKYKDSDKILPFPCRITYNKGIRELLKHCKIDRMVTILDTHGLVAVQKPLYEVATSHTARKTFIGNLYKKVSDPNLIGSMSGHVEGSRAFARYRTIDEDMKRKLVEMID